MKSEIAKLEPFIGFVLLSFGSIAGAGGFVAVWVLSAFWRVPASNRVCLYCRSRITVSGRTG